MCVAGPSSTRVLIFGSGPAVGWGVTSHELALPGALARTLASRSGRGADVEVIADMRITVRNALSILRGIDIEPYSVIVIVLGANDAVTPTSATRWRSRLSEVLAHLAENTSRSAQLFVTGVPPIRSVPGFDSRFGAVAEEHATLLNRESAELCASRKAAAFVPLPAVDGRSANRYGDGRTYRQWATAIAEIIAPSLHSARWGATIEGVGESTENTNVPIRH